MPADPVSLPTLGPPYRVSPPSVASTSLAVPRFPGILQPSTFWQTSPVLRVPEGLKLPDYNFKGTGGIPYATGPCLPISLGGVTLPASSFAGVFPARPPASVPVPRPVSVPSPVPLAVPRPAPLALAVHSPPSGEGNTSTDSYSPGYSPGSSHHSPSHSAHHSPRSSVSDTPPAGRGGIAPAFSPTLLPTVRYPGPVYVPASGGGYPSDSSSDPSSSSEGGDMSNNPYWRVAAAGRGIRNPPSGNPHVPINPMNPAPPVPGVGTPGLVVSGAALRPVFPRHGSAFPVPSGVPARPAPTEEAEVDKVLRIQEEVVKYQSEQLMASLRGSAWYHRKEATALKSLRCVIVCYICNSCVSNVFFFVLICKNI